MSSTITPDEIIEFWFSQPMNQHWFKSTPEIDHLIRQKYEAFWREASAEKSAIQKTWKQTPQGCLALIIVFDQFPLNMFRSKPESFATESRSIELALFGIEQAYDRQITRSQLSFFYMPLMHSEQLDHQERSVDLFERAGLDSNIRFAKHHREIIRRFGRFPHRNIILGRQSTEAERVYLTSKEAFHG